MTKPSSGDRYEVRSLVRGLRLLETLERVGTPMRLTDLSDELEIERATLFRYTSTLTRHGYMHVDPPTKLYSLGPRVRSLGYAAQQQWAWLDEVRVRLPAVAEQFHGAASFAVQDGAEIIYIERFVANGALNYQINPGDRLPAWSTSIGKVLLAELDDSDVQNLLSEHDADCDIDDLVAELAKIRRAALAVNSEGITAGINSVAVPLRLSEHSVPVGGINLAGPARDLPLDRLREEVVPVLLRVATGITSPSATPT